MGIPAMHGSQAYEGAERRRHTVLITRNSEYHCRDGVCIAVRDCRTGRVALGHHAIGLRLSGAIGYDADGDVDHVSPPGDLHPGEHLCFSARGMGREEEVITSPLIAIERPPRHVVARYEAA
jgi:hypothetical protein